MKMAQSGQYNFPRCNKRKEYVASHLALSEFMSVSMSLVYLLNHSYRPYYKWVHRGLLSLPVLGKTAYDKMQRLSVLSLEKRLQRNGMDHRRILCRLRERVKDTETDFFF